MSIIKKIEQAQVEKLRGDKKIPAFKSGDTVKVHVRIKDGDKFRIQVFEGVVIARDGGNGNNASFTVRRESYGVGVERKFPLYSPAIAKIEKCAPVRYVVQNCSSCADCPAKRRAS